MMDINNIQLSASAIADLYTSSLIESDIIYTGNENKATTVESPIAEESWKWLGENKKKILIVVRYDDTMFLPDAQLQFLTGMLGACNLSLGDVAIININKQSEKDYKNTLDHFQSRIALLFDIEPSSFALPMNFPHFQIQPFASCSFLYAPSLESLENDKVLKSKLWVVLRRLFNI